jgi:hypothetical protein
VSLFFRIAPVASRDCRIQSGVEFTACRAFVRLAG